MCAVRAAPATGALSLRSLTAITQDSVRYPGQSTRSVDLSLSRYTSLFPGSTVITRRCAPGYALVASYGGMLGRRWRRGRVAPGRSGAGLLAVPSLSR